MAYLLDLTEKFHQIYTIFLVSQLRKCLVDDSVVVPLDNIQFDKRLNYMEILVMIIDSKMRTLYKKVVPFVKV